MYRIIKPFLFLLSAESAHRFTFTLIRFTLLLPGMKWLFKKAWTVEKPQLRKLLFGLEFPNPVGLAAGFDKDGKISSGWKYFGFGFIEVGTVTPEAQPGNPRPRLFRLKKDQALINRMGFNNEGTDVLLRRLKKMRRNGIVVGGNIGKNKHTPNENAVDDYLKCFQALHLHVDYFVVNVSSPNTPGLRDLQEKEPLTRLLKTLQEENSKLNRPRPLLLKIAPDLSEGQIEDIIEIVQDTKLSGLVATNTTISREGLSESAERIQQIGAGGLSGRPLAEKSREIVSLLRSRLGPDFPIIGVGGIMEPEDAQKMMEAGADLVQVYTGFVYGGPGFIRKTLEHLSA